MVKDPSRVNFSYRDNLWQGSDLLATGIASFGHISGVHYQNHPEWEQYCGSLEAGELPLSRGLRLSQHQRLIREMILQLKLGHVSRAYFRKKFGVEITERFAEPMQRLKDWGFLEIEGDQVLLNREGLLQVDRLFQEFFLPQHKNARYD